MSGPIAEPRGEAPASAGGRLDGFEALRGVAAMAVLIGHAAALTHTAALSFRLYLAVDLFFALSGYVMARSYEARLAAGLGVVPFLELRVRRVWPTMACGAVLGLAWSWSLGWWSLPFPNAAVLALFLQCLVFVPSVAGFGTLFAMNFPTWSIFFELCSNCVHALLFRRMTTLQLGLLAAACLATLLAWQQGGNPGQVTSAMILGFPRAFGSYCLGIVLWRTLRDHAVLPPVGLLLFPAYLAATHWLNQGLAIDWAFMALVGPLCVVTGLGPVPFARVFRLLGALSFPLYAVHGPVVLFMAGRGFGFAPSVAAAIAVAVGTMTLTGAKWRVRGRAANGAPALPT